MRCSLHPESEAVGACETCGRGLCQSCAIETAAGLACAEHEERVGRVDGLDDGNPSSGAADRRIGPRRWVAASCFLAAAVCFAVSAVEGGPDQSPALGALGILCLALGAMFIGVSRSRREGDRPGGAEDPGVTPVARSDGRRSP